MRKEKIHFFRQIPRSILLILFIVSAFVTLFALRQNNTAMVRLRDEVYKADKEGGDVNKALNNLRSYVYGHMNTNLSSGGNSIKPPIQLKYTYERLQKVEQERVDTINSKVYTDAQNYCQALNSVDFSGRNRVPCITEYVTSHGAKAQPIPAALYQFDFVSPTWSPDFAGWSLLITAVLLLAYAINLALDHIVGRPKDA